MNNKGQVWAYSIMLGLTIIVIALALAPALQSFTSNAMNASTADFIGLDCNNASVSNFVKGTCVITDFSLAYFAGGLLLIGGGIILARIAF